VRRELKRAIYCFSLFYTRYTRTNVLSFFDVIPSFFTHLLLRSKSFPMPPAKNVFGCARSRCRSAAGVQYISDSTPSVLQNKNINSSNIARLSWKRRMARAVSINATCSATLELSTHRYTFLDVIKFSPYCANILLWISEGFIPSDHKNWMTARAAQQWNYSEASLNVTATPRHS
jgi:hypothetical protein